MGMTMTQKILARHAGLDHVVPGQLVEGKLDLVLGNDITTPVAISEFNKAGLTRVFDREKIALVLDHYTPCKDIKSAEQAMMAALAGKTDTILRNCATEPEVADLAGFLRGCGFTIYGGGTETIFIKGAANAPRARQKELRGETTYFIVEDRIEAATYLMAALGSGGRILLRNTRARLLTEVLCVLRRMGAELRCFEDLIELRAPACLRSPGIVITAPYPGFPTDCQPQLMSLAAAARGLTTVREEIFENRFTHKKELSKMGADIEICGKNAIIKGTAGLQGCDVTARDLRGGAALIIAGLSAEGVTEILDSGHIERGYEDLDSRLRELGAEIERSA